MDLQLSKLFSHYQLLHPIHRIVLILVHPLLAIAHYQKGYESDAMIIQEYEKETTHSDKKTANSSHLISFSVMCKRNLSCFVSLRDWY